MQQVTKTAFSFTFFLGTVFVSLVSVQGGWNIFGNIVASDTIVPFNGVRWVSQNTDTEVFKYINMIIGKHQQASYTYLKMAFHFNRADVALPGFAKYFRESSERELATVDRLAAYLTRRGEAVAFNNIKSPDTATWDSGLVALLTSLNIQKKLNGQHLDLHKMAGEAEDPHLTFTIEDHLLDPNVDIIKDIADKAAVLERMSGSNYNLAEYIFDKSL